MSENSLENKIDIIKECVKYINRVLPIFEEVCTNIRKSEKLETISEISEGFMNVLKIVEYTQDIVGIKIQVEDISNFVFDMVDGMENGDYGLVADIIEYEITPLYEQWEEAFRKVID